ncbi:hypothetical protein [Rhodosalinus sp.]|uniref:hypothetical protein n=1 Tax=Rhodosalinus sp. TaxID=2047741 RepID=UPI00397BF2C6
MILAISGDEGHPHLTRDGGADRMIPAVMPIAGRGNGWGIEVKAVRGKAPHRGPLARRHILPVSDQRTRRHPFTRQTQRGKARAPS